MFVLAQDEYFINWRVSALASRPVILGVETQINRLWFDTVTFWRERSGHRINCFRFGVARKNDFLTDCSSGGRCIGWRAGPFHPNGANAVVVFGIDFKRQYVFDHDHTLLLHVAAGQRGSLVFGTT